MHPSHALVALLSGAALVAGQEGSAQAAPPSLTVLSPSTKPAGRTGPGRAAMEVVTASPRVERLWFFGGSALTLQRDLWSYDTSAGNWAQVTGMTGTPSARAWHVLGWEPNLKRLVLLGGCSNLNGPPLADLYLYDPATKVWSTPTVSPSRPTQRYLASFHWIPHLNQFLFFGGGSAGTSAAASAVENDLWLLKVDSTSAVTWTRLDPAAPLPPPRAAACSGYDPARRTLVVFGGESTGSSFFNDTWQYGLDANAWTQDSPTGTVPSARTVPGCTFDERTGFLVARGGTDATNGTAINDAHAYDAVAKVWTPLSFSPAPSHGVASPAPIFSAALGGLFYYGGRGANIITFYNESVVIKVNLPPVASAGAPQTVGEGVTVTLDASGSTDGDGDALTYAWAQTAGTTVALSSTTSAKPTFLSPAVAAATALGFEVAVSDGTATAKASTTVNVLNDVDEAPVANAGPDQQVDERATVQLDGSLSSDPNGDPLLFAWAQTGGPAATLSSASIARPTFTAPEAAVATPLTFELTVDDQKGRTAQDTVQITVRNAFNDLPVANAGPDQQVDEATAVQLDGSPSSDPNLDGLTYAWLQTSGPAVTLSQASVARPTFTAPRVTAAQALGFQLMVDDGKGGAASDEVSVLVRDSLDEPPVASAGPDQSVAEGALVTLDSSGSTDPNGDPLTQSWAQVGGATVALANPLTAAPAFTAPAGPDALAFEVTVADGRGLSATDRVSISVVAAPRPDAGAPDGSPDPPDALPGPSDAMTDDGGPAPGADGGGPVEADGGGETPDAGALPDGSSIGDPTDAAGAPRDAGAQAGADAAADAGPHRIAFEVGCGCASGGGGPWGALALLALGLLQRRTRKTDVDRR